MTAITGGKAGCYEKGAADDLRIIFETGEEQSRGRPEGTRFRITNRDIHHVPPLHKIRELWEERY